MSNFQSSYLTLLRRQVDEEIEYLVRNGHNNDKISVPCMFCVQHQQGYYYCKRLIDLRQFQSSIISHNSTTSKPYRDVPKERKRIGYTEPIPEISPREGTFNLRSDLNLPLMSVKL